MTTPCRLLLPLALALACLACKKSPAAPPAQEAAHCQLVKDDYGPEGQTAVQAKTVVDGLEVPWGIAFLPGGDLLVTERRGRLRLVRGGALVPQPVATLPLEASGEGGLLGIALHPSFETNRLFYLAYTHREADKLLNRIERWKLADDANTASPDRVILDGIPAHSIHDGGRLRVGPDKRLYLTTGDAGNPTNSQDPASLAGKMLRVGLDGEIPEDNPTPGSPVFLLGLRNSQGFDWWQDGTLVLVDHGPSGEMGKKGLDELNLARAGENLGWPRITGCEPREGMVSPLLTWTRAAPPGGLAIYRSGEIPGWRDSVLIGTLGSRHLHRVVLGPPGEGIRSHEVYFRGDPPAGLGRLREVIVDPDGRLLLTTSNCDGRGTCPPEKDRIVRIAPGGT